MKWMLPLGSLGAALMLTGSGCYTSPDGRIHAGVPFVADSVEGRYERPVMDCWTAAKDVLNSLGRIYTEDVQKSTLEATVHKNTVWVKVEAMDATVTKVTVQNRGNLGGADVGIASEIDKQIALRLATKNLTPATAPTGK